MSYDELKKAYEILECTPDMSLEDIKKKFKKLAKMYHPDVAEDKELAAVKMPALSAAFDLINESFKANIKLDDLKYEEEKEEYYQEQEDEKSEFNNYKEKFSKVYDVYEYFRKRKAENEASYKNIKNRVVKIEKYFIENGNSTLIENYLADIYDKIYAKENGVSIIFPYSKIKAKLEVIEENIEKRKRMAEISKEGYEQRKNELLRLKSESEREKIKLREESWNSLTEEEQMNIKILLAELHESFRELQDVRNNLQLSVFSNNDSVVNKIDYMMKFEKKRYDDCLELYQTTINFRSVYDVILECKNSFEKSAKLNIGFDPYNDYLARVQKDIYSGKGKYLEENLVKSLIEERAPIDLIIWYLSSVGEKNQHKRDYYELCLRMKLKFYEKLDYINEKADNSLFVEVKNYYREKRRELNESLSYFLDVDKKYNNASYSEEKTDFIGMLNSDSKEVLEPRLKFAREKYNRSIDSLVNDGITLNSRNMASDEEYAKLRNRFIEVKHYVSDDVASEMVARARDTKDSIITMQFMKEVSLKIDFIFKQIEDMIEEKAPVEGIEWYLEFCNDRDLNWYIERYDALNKVREEVVIDEIEIPDFMNRDVRHGR